MFKKIIFTILFTISIISYSLNAQNNSTRYSNCGGGGSSSLYLTPYVGIGSANYSYNLNKTVIDNDSNIYNTESGKPYTIIAGLNIMYNLGRSNLGGGAEWQNFNGKTDNGLYKTELSLYYYKFYARYEFAIYTDPFNDFGLFLEGGILFPKNAQGDFPELGTNFKAGAFYNYIITPNSSIIASIDYQHASFNTQIGNGISEHITKDFKISLGYRFWFN